MAWVFDEVSFIIDCVSSFLFHDGSLGHTPLVQSSSGTAAGRSPRWSRRSCPFQLTIDCLSLHCAIILFIAHTSSTYFDRMSKLVDVHRKKYVLSYIHLYFSTMRTFHTTQFLYSFSPRKRLPQSANLSHCRSWIVIRICVGPYTDFSSWHTGLRAPTGSTVVPNFVSPSSKIIYHIVGLHQLKMGSLYNVLEPISNHFLTTTKCNCTVPRSGADISPLL